MIVAYADSSAHRKTVRRSLPDEQIFAPDRDPEATVPQAEERKALASADCVIFAYRSDALQKRIAWIADWSERLHGVPMILVTDPTRNLARRLAPLAFTAIVWFGDVHDRLRDEVARARQQSAFEDVIDEIRRSELPPRLVRGLVCALSASEPFKRVADLAAAAGIPASTLRHEFRDAAPEAYRLEDFLSALQVLHAHQSQAVGATWTHAAKSIHITLRTLRAKAKAWPGCTPSALEALTPASMFERFRDNERVSPLIHRGSSVPGPQAS